VISSPIKSVLGLKFFISANTLAISYSSDCVFSTSLLSATELPLSIAVTAMIITTHITVVNLNPREDGLLIALPMSLPMCHCLCCFVYHCQYNL